MACLKYTFLLLNLHWAAYGLGIPQVPKLPIPKGNVKVVELEACEPSDIPMSIDAHFDVIRGDDKALSLTANMPKSIDGGTSFSVVADKWMDDEWFLNYYSHDGLICDTIDKHFSKLWSIFSKAVIPNLGNDCKYPSGNYTFKDFEINQEDCEFPSVLVGLFRGHFRMYDGDGSNFMCLVVTLDIWL